MNVKNTILLLVAAALAVVLVLGISNAGMAKSIFEILKPVPRQADISTQSTALVGPEGFNISIYAKDLPGARVLALDNMGNLLVSQTSEGKIVALLADRDGDGKSDGTRTLLTGLHQPHGIVVSGHYLYIAERDAVSRYVYDTDGVSTSVSGEKELLFSLPYKKGYRHSTRTLLIGPDPISNSVGEGEMLFVSIGSSCDVCREEDPKLATILKSDLDGKNLEVYAKGLRNSVFMELHPVTGALWATEMGRDWLGDNDPPDEINIIEKDKNYGWPVCYGNNMHDTEFDKNTYIRNPCMSPFETPSHIDLKAHSAPLGLAFIPEEGWPEEWWYNALVAYHGSWNSNMPAGYTIVRLPLDSKGKPIGAPVDFISGFRDAVSGVVSGRPVDLLVLSGGTIYITDDYSGVVYKLSRKKE